MVSWCNNYNVVGRPGGGVEENNKNRESPLHSSLFPYSLVERGQTPTLRVRALQITNFLTPNHVLPLSVLLGGYQHQKRTILPFCRVMKNRYLLKLFSACWRVVSDLRQRFLISSKTIWHNIVLFLPTGVVWKSPTKKGGPFFQYVVLVSEFALESWVDGR